VADNVSKPIRPLYERPRYNHRVRRLQRKGPQRTGTAGYTRFVPPIPEVVNAQINAFTCWARNLLIEFQIEGCLGQQHGLIGGQEACACQRALIDQGVDI